jgi:predicted porin
MKQWIITTAFALAAAAPFGAASAQDAATLVCADYAALDNAGQMAAIADIEALNSQMATSQDMSADEIHEQLTAECGNAPDALVADAWKKIRGM